MGNLIKGGAARNLIGWMPLAKCSLKPASPISQLLVWIFHSSMVRLSAAAKEQGYAAATELFEVLDEYKTQLPYVHFIG